MKKINVLFLMVVLIIGVNAACNQPAKPIPGAELALEMHTKIEVLRANVLTTSNIGGGWGWVQVTNPEDNTSYRFTKMATVPGRGIESSQSLVYNKYYRTGDEVFVILAMNGRPISISQEILTGEVAPHVEVLIVDYDRAFSSDMVLLNPKK